MATNFRPLTTPASSDRVVRPGVLLDMPTLPRSPVIMLDRDTLLGNGIFGFDPLDPRSRSFIMLRSQLLNRFYGAGGRTIAVTSTQPGNGKTFVTTNLATALSRIRPTALIDLDLRQPTLGSRFGIFPAAGIDDYLSGDADLDHAAHAVSEFHLTIVPVRKSRINSAELLADPRLTEMFMTFRSKADDPICIVDTPPILALDDILVISKHVDGILLVVEEGCTRQDELKEAIRLLDPTPIVGTVLNKSITGMRKKDVDKYYYYK